ncbi:MAG: hypothetical protein HUU38_24805, partial [Anaerolineales bacterium]|nr:hypothetical protein [Anaerolineales bacterium]
LGYRAEVTRFRTMPRPDTTNVFTVTPAHLAMLKRLTFYHDWGDDYLGGAYISHRRPYGNSAIYGDIAELAGLPQPDWDAGEDWTDTQIQHMLGLHYDMAQVLNLAVELYPEPLTPGLYTRHHPFHPWQKQPEPPEQVLNIEPADLDAFEDEDGWLEAAYEDRFELGDWE